MQASLLKKMFSDDPCSNAQQWAEHAMRATPKGCKLVHFSVTFDPDGGCRTSSEYSAPSKSQGKKTATEKVGSEINRDAGHRKGGSKTRRLQWRAYRQKTRQKLLQSAWESLKRAPSNEGNATDAVETPVTSVLSATEMYGAEQAAPTVAGTAENAVPATCVAAPSLHNQAVCFGDTAQVSQQDKHHCTDTLNPNPDFILPPNNTKRQKTYAEAAVELPPSPNQPHPNLNHPMHTPLHTPNGTRGFYAGAQSLTPRGTQVACWMERQGETDLSTERRQLNELTFMPPITN